MTVLTWEEYFMGMAILSSFRSKDPNTKVGACIVNNENRIIGIGYNGFPSKCSDNKLPWSRTGDTPLDTKYPYVIHAEVNAILNSNLSLLKDCILYVTLFPCCECAKIIIQSGIRKVIYLNKPEWKGYENSFKATEKLFYLSEVIYKKYENGIDKIILNYE